MFFSVHLRHKNENDFNIIQRIYDLIPHNLCKTRQRVRQPSRFQHVFQLLQIIRAIDFFRNLKGNRTKLSVEDLFSVCKQRLGNQQRVEMSFDHMFFSQINLSYSVWPMAIISSSVLSINY